MREAEMKVLERVRPSPLVRGHGKIELFDARSLRKVAEVPFENAIHNLQLAHAKWRVHTAFSDYPPLSPTNTSWQVSNGLQLNNSDPEPLYAMRDLMCFEDASAINVADEIIRGRIIAWSAKDFYVGSDIRRGGMNQVETLFRSDYVRWVADWPTSAGNGTFASIGWGYLDENNTAWQAQSSKLLSSGYVASTNNTLYPSGQRQGGSQQPTYSPTNELWILSNDRHMWRAGTAAPLWIAPNNIQDVSWGSSALFGTAYSSTNALNSSYCALYQLNPSTGAVVATTSFPRLSPSGLSNASAVRFCMIDDTHMYVLYINEQRIYQYTLAGSTWGSPVLVPAPVNSQTVLFFSRYANGDILSVDNGGSPTRWNPADGSLRWQSFGFNSSNNGWNIAAKQDGTDAYTITGGQSNDQDYTIRFFTRIPYGLGTRVLLPTAVTKSNLQTMKITYQFDFS